MSTRGSRRSFTGNHEILPAAEARIETVMSIVPDREFISWTFGRGTVIHKIWPAVLLHTLVAAVITTISLKTKYWLGIPSVMLTVLGLVLGFVISYRASSGYDRFWMGRSGWGDVIRTSRTLARIIWFHVPLRLGPNTKTGIEVDGVVVEEEEDEEAEVMMAEKMRALDLVQAFVISLKHHLRGEVGVYYEDLYPLVRSQRHHLHMHHSKKTAHTPEEAAAQLAGEATLSAPSGSNGKKSRPSVYGTFESVAPGHTSAATTLVRRPSGISSSAVDDSDRSSCSSSDDDDDRSDEHHTLLPSRTRKETAGYFEQTNADLIPFESFFSAIGRVFARVGRAFRRRDRVYKIEEVANRSRKHRPRVAGGGQNLPLEILRGFSEWGVVLEERGAIPGSALGTIYSSIAAYEDSLCTLEKILTTPLPFVFSCHLRHTVWLYLFFLPFQLIKDFGWHTIPGVAVASFIYLGFLAVGDEIEQPFGYEENDLELDLFCHDVVREDVAWLKRTPCRNARVPLQVGEVQHRNALVSIADDRVERHVRRHKRKARAAKDAVEGKGK